MLKVILVFGTALLCAIGFAMIVITLLPGLAKKLYQEMHEALEEKFYQKICQNWKLTPLGKLLLVLGIFLTIIAIILLLFII